jgi:hypothetical protein
MPVDERCQRLGVAAAERLDRIERIARASGSLPSGVCSPAHDSSRLAAKDCLQRTVHLNFCQRYHMIIRIDCRVERIGPTTPTRPSRLPLALWQRERLPCCRILFAAEPLSPSIRERVLHPQGRRGAG